ncbi:LamG domain-containing protein [bacterium]|nr:LamG domain-containing protein [bacterium]
MPTGLGDEQLWISATNDNTGTSTAFDDQSGNGNDGVTVGAVTVSADTGDGGTYAFNLAAGSDGITLPADIISGLTEYSYGIWVKLAGGQASSSNILGGYDSSNTETNPTFFVGATDHLRVLGKTDSGSTISYDIENPATSGVWKHLFFTYSAANGLKTYENGVLLNTYTTQPSTGGDGTVPFAIGKSYHNATICLTDDARVYHREITQAEVTHLATSRGTEGPPAQSVIEHSFSYAQSFPSSTLDLTVQAGCDLYIIGFIEGQVNRYLTGMSDDVHGAWDSFDTLYEGINNLPKSWVGRVANHTGGTISITPAFNATASNIGAITVLELRGYQFKSETSYDNTARLGTLIAAATPVAVASGDFAIASHSTNANITPTYSEAGWSHLTLQSNITDRSFLSTQEVAGSYDFEVTNAGNRYGAGSFALYEPAGGGPTTQYNAFITHAFKQLFQARLR